VNVRNSWTGSTALMEVVSKRQYRVANVFLKYKAVDIEATNGNEQSPLHVACALADVDSIKLLTSHGADVRKTDNEGGTPLQHAINPQDCSNYGLLNDDRYQSVNYLLRKGAISLVERTEWLQKRAKESKMVGILAPIHVIRNGHGQLNE